MSTQEDGGARIAQLAVKNMWLRASRELRPSKGMLSFYEKICTVPLPTEFTELSDKVQLINLYQSKTMTTIRDLAPDRDNSFICVEVYGNRLVRVACNLGFEILPVEKKVSSFVRTLDGYVCISSATQEIFTLDESFSEKKRSRLDKGEMMLDGGSRIAAVDDRFVVTNMKRNTLYILEKDYTLLKSIDTHGLAYMHDVVGFNDGVVFTESMQGNTLSGGLLWMDKEGRMTAFYGGLKKTLNISTWDEGLVVCDFDGIHILRTSGLAVLGHDIIPWHVLARAVGRRHGYVCEAVYRPGKITAVVRDVVNGVNAYGSFCLCELKVL